MGVAAASCTDAEQGGHGKKVALAASRSRQGHKHEGVDKGTKFYHDKMRISVASQAVFKAAQCGDVRGTLTALNTHGDPNCINSAGYTALMLAVGGGYREISAMLLKAGANPNYALDGLTALMIASAAGSIDIARMVNC